MYRLKGRPREKRSALMYFSVEDVPDLPAPARGLLPGPVSNRHGAILADGRGIRVPDGPRLATVPCSRRAPTRRAGRIPAGSRTSIPRFARAWTSRSTAGSCRGPPRPWWT